MFRVIGAFYFVMALCAAPEALAAPNDPRSVVVRSDDLDVTTPSGARALLRRIERATGLVCDASFARQYPAARRGYLACRRETMTRVVSQLRAPRLEDALAQRLAQHP